MCVLTKRRNSRDFFVKTKTKVNVKTNTKILFFLSLRGLETETLVLKAAS